ncbi:hypothetical protein ACJIZ3_023444 [Penstemon smallii]|uniref:F-box domain-containing protein n=1 Tax=Penstemon smallii TaxID=265156 RepID=A0ABD3TR19_9LAMI
MEIEIANEVKIMNLKSLTGVKDGIKDGDIPDWLLLEVLVRLPQKVVFRFKLVSKQWLSFILDPSFIKIYCSRALSLQMLQPWTFVSTITYFNGFERMNIPDCELLVDIYSSKWPSFYALSLPRLHETGNSIYVIYEVSNGLVLYGVHNESTEKGIWEIANYRICNPVTGQWISLPPHNSRQNSVSWGFMTNVEDGILMRYSVVRLYVSDANQSKFVRCEVFLSEVGEWKTYIVPIYVPIEIVVYRSSAILNGVMHSMLSEHGLIAYDPHKHPDHVRVIALPGDQIFCPFFHICAAYQGKLRYFRVSGKSEDWKMFQSFDIWVLNDYSSCDWCLQHRVCYIDVQISTVLSGQNLARILPISFHPYDTDIVYLGYETMIISYNIKTRKLEVLEDFRQVRDIKCDWLICDWLRVRLLLIPPWPISLSRPIFELQKIS